MTSAELVVLACYSVVVAAVSFEAVWLWQADPARVRRHWPAAGMGLGGLAAGAVLSASYAVVWPALSGLAPAPLREFWGPHPVLAAVAAFVIWDAASWVYHLLGHTTAIGWASHRVHHSGERYDLSLAFRQSWFPLPALVVFPFIALAGFELPLVAAVAAASAVFQALCHLSFDVRAPLWVAAVVITPSLHRRHHLAGAGAVNLGAVFTVWDRLFGTWDPEPLPARPVFGIPGHPDALGAARTELAGWRNLVRSTQDSSAARRTEPRHG